MKVKLYPMRACEQCWETFEPHQYNQKYCSEKCRLLINTRQATKRREQSLLDGSGGAYLKLRFTVFSRDNFTCQYCGRGVKNGAILHVDHLCPTSNGGKLAKANLITSCFECNEGKGDVLLSKREEKRLKAEMKTRQEL